MSTGNVHTCGIRTDGTAWCWGANWYGQLGYGTNSNSPVQAGSATNWAVVEAGAYHNVALTS